MFRVIAKHETLAARIQKMSAIAQHRGGHFHTLATLRMDDYRRLELHEFHIDERSPRVQGKGVGIRSDVGRIGAV